MSSVKSITHFVLGVVLLTSTTAHAQTAMDTFSVNGTVQTPQSYSVADIQHDFAAKIKSIQYTLKGRHHSAHVVALEDVLEASKPKLDLHIKNAQLQAMVAVTGRDGYTVTFSLGELLPNFGHEAVWIAIDQDVKPLSADDAPIELIVPGDIKAGRWVHSVADISLSMPFVGANR